MFSTGHIYFSRDVLFDEFTFPYSNFSSHIYATTTAQSNTSHSLVTPVAIPTVTPIPSAPVAPIISHVLDSTNASLTSPTTPSVHVDSHSRDSQTSSSDSSTRYMLPPNVTSAVNTHPMLTRGKQGIIKPKAFSATLEPTTVKAALNDPKWKVAMIDEYKALQTNGTWDLVPLPAGKVPIGSKWVFKLKHKHDGSIECYKACLVSKGFHKLPGFDFSETFSPVVKRVTVRVVISHALSNGWCLRQLDINNAFLHGNLVEEVFMTQPDGFFTEDSSLVCKLKKSLYGLRQAPRTWFDKLTATLCFLGFHRAKSDASLFLRCTPTPILYLLVYVDDIIVTGSVSKEVAATISTLSSTFSLKDLGNLHYFLGLQVTPSSSSSIILHQTKYISDLLLKVNMNECKPQSTPMEANLKLYKDCTDTFENPKLYRFVMGTLQYVCVIRPELAFSVNKVSQFMHSPLVSH